MTGEQGKFTRSKVSLYKIFFQYLSKGGKDPGTTLDELMEIVKIHRNLHLSRLIALEIMASLEKFLAPLGLVIKYIPGKKRFVLKHEQLVRESKSNILSGGAVSTLLTIASLLLETNEPVKFDDIKKARNVGRTTLEGNLRELVRERYIKKRGRGYILTNKALIALDLISVDEKNDQHARGDANE